MGEEHISSSTQQPLSSESPDFNSTAAPVPCSVGLNAASSPEGSPMHTSPGLPNSRIGQFNQPKGWFYCLPRFRQAYMPGPNYSAPKQKLSINYGNSDLNAEKKFLVFDQSGDRTTVMVSSGPGTPFHCVTSWTWKQMAHSAMDDGTYGAKPDSYPASRLVSGNDLHENCENADVMSEMHEDTEELNALLYSDDEEGETYDSEDDEVLSTGHSPSTMTAHERPDNFHREDNEEVASSFWPRKRKWNVNDVEALDDTASSCNINGQSNYLSNDADAKSRCAGWENLGLLKIDLSSESKRPRRDKICKTVELLHEMIPVLDEAIDYHKSLKVSAEALGLAAL